MKPLFSLSMKSGLVALALATGIPLAAQAGPMPQPAPSVPANASAPDIVKVRDNWDGDRRWKMRRHDGHRWNGDRRWNNGRDWRRGPGWSDDRRWHRRHHHHHRRYYGGGSGFYLGLGLLPAYPLYDNYYYRPTYRARLSRAHVEWCYARYRSYRAYDNTYQPNYGPRRQCRGPY